MLEDDYVSAGGNDSEDILAHMVSLCPVYFVLSLICYVQLSSDLQDRPDANVRLLRVSTSGPNNSNVAFTSRSRFCLSP